MNNFFQKIFGNRNQNSININGKIIASNVSDITIKNGEVFIDGKQIPCESKNITITVTGNVDNISSGSGKVHIHGAVLHDVKSGSGDVSIGEYVTGDVTTGSGDVRISKDLTGDVKTGSGDINCITYTGTFKSGSGRMRIKPIH